MRPWGISPMTTIRTLTGALATLLAVTSLIGCGSDYPTTGTAKSAPAGTAGAATPAKSTPVRVVPAMEERAAGVVVASGTLAAEEQVVLSIKVAGRLAEITVDLGTRVKQGDVVARARSHRLPAPGAAGGDRPPAGAGAARPAAATAAERPRRSREDRRSCARRARVLDEALLHARSADQAPRSGSSSRGPSSTRPRRPARSRRPATRTRSRRCATAWASSPSSAPSSSWPGSSSRTPCCGRRSTAPCASARPRSASTSNVGRAGGDDRAHQSAAAPARGARARGGRASAQGQRVRLTARGAIRRRTRAASRG